MAKGLIGGKLPHIYWAELRRKSKGLNRGSAPIKRTPIKKKYSPKKNKIPGMYECFVRWCEECTWICEECGANVFSTDEKFQLGAQAHLLPKEFFRSVAKHDANHKCLGPQCGCHRKYDKSWESARKMKIWPDVEEIIITKLIPLLTQEEYRRLPDFLKEKYDSTRVTEC